MDTAQLNKWLSLAANFGVIAGIIFLVFEIQQSNSIAIATTELSIRENYITFHEYTLLDENVAKLILKAGDANAEFTPLEEERIYAYVGLYINQWIATETAYRYGMLPRTSFEIVFEDIRGILGYSPAMKPYFREFITDYPSIDNFETTATIREVTEVSQ